MAITNGSNQPVYGQAFQCTFEILNYTTANALTGGLTTLASTISKDGGNYTSTTTAPTEIQTSGTGYISLSATEMQADVIKVQVTAANANAVYDLIEIRPLRLTDIANHWMTHSKIRFEQAMMLVSGILSNLHTLSQSADTVYGRDNATVIGTASVSGLQSPGGTVTRNEMT